MSSKPWSGKKRDQRVEDIFAAIRDIEAFIEGMTQADFIKDKKTISAVERELLRIGEACVALCKMEEDEVSADMRLVKKHPGVPWHQIKAIGNILRHEYGRSDYDIIWNTISSSDLTKLKQALSSAYPHAV